MAMIAPFPGVHFPPSRALPDLLAPPYDIISPADHERLAALHAHNIVHLTLGTPGRRRDYPGIGARLRRWIHEGVLVQDPQPAFYAYCQEFVHEGTVQKFWGVLGLLRLEPFGAGMIFPHEAVHAGPVEDRLKIMEGTRANLEPIISLYRSPSDPMNLLFESLEAQPPSIAAADATGSRHRLWTLDAPRTRARIQRTVRRLPFFIADGHHRYHSAWLYRARHRRNRDAQWMLSLIANTEQRGLKILPYHRIVTCEAPVPASLPQDCGRFGKVEKLGRSAGAALAAPARGVLGFSSRAAGAWLLHLPPLPAGTAPRGQLEVARLHDLLPQLVRVKAVDFTRDAAEAVQAALRSPHVLACCLPAPSSAQITQIAFDGETLPQKSTFFLPKPASGLLLRLF
ncbi:MAG: DUF1015 domain-containing protein [Candidatus Coatesbacteria bacterium]